MNLEIANRLVEYRKKAGYSQEELADKLGISRQAVSKWERVEASPDTDNLIALANLYGVSLDELINGKKETTQETINDSINNNEKEEKAAEPKTESNEQDDWFDSDRVKFNKGIHIKGDDGGEVHIDKRGIRVKDGHGHQKDYDPDECCKKHEDEIEQHVSVGIVYSLTALLSTVAFFLVGSLCQFPTLSYGTLSGWSVSWILFINIPVLPSLVDSFVSHRFSKFNMPCFVTTAFCALGMFCGWWHPAWVVFFLIPVYYTSVTPIDKAIKRRERRRKVVAESNCIISD